MNPANEAARSHSLTLPWAAWRPDGESRTFDFPSGWTLEALAPRGWPPDAAPDMAGLAAAVGKACAGAASACVVVDDLTRPAPLAPILQIVTGALVAAGIAESAIDLVIATGAHGSPGPDERARKVGASIAHRFPVRVHDAAATLADTGLKLGETPLRLDPGFLDADFRLGVSSLIPNPFAGFSGGGKLVLPGLADLAALEWLHKLGMMGFAGGVGRTRGNRIRKEIDRVAAELPFHFWVGCLVDTRRAVREIVYGSPARAFREGCDRARTVYATPMDGEYDVLFCNAYPKDGEFIQAENGYSPLRTGGLDHLRPDGGVVLMAAAHKGRGVHGLFDAGMPLHRAPAGPKKYLGDVPASVFSPGIEESDCRVTHWDGYPFFAHWDRLIDALLARHGDEARVGVFPAASCQLGPAPEGS